MKCFYHSKGTLFLLLGACLGLFLLAPAQAQSETDLTQAVQDLKKDPKGPYQAVKWFCPDGKIISPQERCLQPGGLQHGLVKEWVARLEQDKKIFLDTVLAGTPYETLWDVTGQYSRLRQYALIQFLFLADEGWIYRNARYYRGAIQAEDENAWGEEFLQWMLLDPDAAARRFFLARDACRVIPHPGLNQNHLQVIRTVSKTLSDEIPAFLDLRVKIHGQPDSSDLAQVRSFMDKNAASLDENQEKRFKELISALEAVYSLSSSDGLKMWMTGKIRKMPELSETVTALEKSLELASVNGQSFTETDPNPYRDMADLLLKIRLLIPSAPKDIRLSLMDFSLELEKTLFSSIENWFPRTISELMMKSRTLTKAAAGCGYIELWEWHAAESFSLKIPDKTMEFKQFQLMVEQLRRIVDWGSLMVRSTYLSEINLYTQFEPKVQGFVDDRIRSSVLLPLGETVGKLTLMAQASSGVSHLLLEGMQPKSVRGLNPGIAYGTLDVVTGDQPVPAMESKKIYAFKTIPPELKPVAGILTVSEGNLVSHVQLLARNLGIPNAVVSSENFDTLKPYSGQQVFYAVSQKGSVVLKPESLMTAQEKTLTQGKKRNLDQFRVPVEKIDLTQKELIALSRIRATDSGKICGPKAANLGQLKFMFPERVVEGIVIPFGIFREHMDQVMPGLSITYWQYLTQALSTPAASEADLIATLAKLQAAIKTMPFLPGFETRMADMFEAAFKDSLGNVPVFVRSDTNMEDIPNFTGAGLNLTVFNVRDREKILQGIRDVWASPYSERSYLWRQKYLENPENVFPSILLLPSVNVDKSGVVITHGIISNTPEDITVAFNRGAGGAVEGQTAETYLLTEPGSDIIMYTARETLCTRLPAAGGTEKEFLSFDQPILTPDERLQIRELVKTVRNILPGTPGIDGQGPFDIELGFINGSMRLFQVRPFVENKKAGTLNYLLQLDQDSSGPETISTDRILEP